MTKLSAVAISFPFIGIHKMLKLVANYNELFFVGVMGNAAMGKLSSDMTRLATFDGSYLGTAQVMRSWKNAFQVECIIDGRVFTGRCGNDLLWRGKAKVARKSTGFQLLTRPDAQPKAVKGEKYGVMTFVLHLAPADVSGHEVCSMRTAACTFFCLNTAGRGAFDSASGTHS
jgi:hypothetical protein